MEGAVGTAATAGIVSWANATGFVPGGTAMDRVGLPTYATELALGPSSLVTSDSTTDGSRALLEGALDRCVGS